MNANRLLQFAQDFVAEYTQFNILGLIQEAITLCTNRPQTSSPAFVTQSNSLKKNAQGIVEKTQFAIYPRSYLDTVDKTIYIKQLPARVAQIIISGLTGDVASTMTANECTAFLSSANVAYNEMVALAATLKKLGVKPIQVDEDRVSIEFSLPRVSFDNVAHEYLVWNERVNSIIVAYNEYIGTEELNPKLVFTSTTDPVVGFTACIHAAYAVTQLINGLLEIGKNAIQLYSAIKQFRESSLVENVEEFRIKADSITEKRVREIVEETLQKFKTGVDEGRANEIRSRIALNAVLLVPIILDGASISISAESLGKITEAKIDLVGEDHPTFLSLLADIRLKEEEVRTAVLLNGGQNLMRLTQQKTQEQPPST